MRVTITRQRREQASFNVDESTSTTIYENNEPIAVLEPGEPFLTGPVVAVLG